MRHFHRLCALQELQQVVRQQEEQCTMLTKHTGSHNNLQQQYALSQTICQQLQLELQDASSALAASQQQVQQLQGAQSKGSKAFSMQANSSLLDTCNADEIGMQQVRPDPTTLDSSSEMELTQSTTRALDSRNYDALRCMQQLSEQIAGLILQPDNLLTEDLPGLHLVEDTLQHALSHLRGALRRKSATAVSKLTITVKHMGRLLEEYKVCPLCMEHDQEFVLNCGHQLCALCSDSLSSCPFCRAPFTRRTKVFRA